MTGRRVFITGASSGIGSALAHHYAGQGAVLGLVARRADRLAELAAELNIAGAASVFTYPLDVTDADALQAAVDASDDDDAAVSHTYDTSDFNLDFSDVVVPRGDITEDEAVALADELYAAMTR